MLFEGQSQAFFDKVIAPAIAADAAQRAFKAGLRDNRDRQVAERFLANAGRPDVQRLVGAISRAREVDDPDLSKQITTSAAAAL